MCLMVYFVEYNRVFNAYQSDYLKIYFDWYVYNIMFAPVVMLMVGGSYNHAYDKSKKLRH